MFTGNMLSSGDALACGLVSKVVPQADLMETAMTMAREIAAKPPLSLSFIKQAVHAGMQAGMAAGLDDERYAAAMLMDSEDRREGMQAFLEKREPVFRGR